MKNNHGVVYILVTDYSKMFFFQIDELENTIVYLTDKLKTYDAMFERLNITGNAGG